MSDPAWLPKLIQFEDYSGDWASYVEAVYLQFHRDFIQTQPQFNGCWVRCRRDPLDQGKEAGFWHCTSAGQEEVHRTPELRRMERIGWVRAIIEHADDSLLDVWVRREGSESRWHLWFREEFMIVLGERSRQDGRRYFQLITAFDTLLEHQKRKQRQQKEKWSPQNG